MYYNIHKLAGIYVILNYNQNIQINSIPDVEQLIFDDYRLNFTEKRAEENYVDIHLETCI